MKKPLCKVCKQPYSKQTTTQKACSWKCAIEYARQAAAQARHKEMRREQRDRKAKLKTRSQWLADAQQNACNPYIRERDKDLPCISCGRYDWEIDDVFRGGKWDAGHFVSRGAELGLRFHWANIHKQCKSCNGGSGKYVRKRHTVSQEYRERLIDRIGLKMVEWLERKDHPAQKWTIDDIKDIKQHYKEQLRLLRGKS